MGLIKLLLFVSILPSAMAAIPREKQFSDPAIVAALRLPLENRIQALKSQGEGTGAKLAEVVNDKGQTLQIRWRAMTALSRVDRELAEREIKKAANSPEWFIRNSAVVSAKNVSRDLALKTIEQAMNDKALVVRSAAVQVAADISAREKTDLLWQKLYAPENSRNGESLWIRKQVARVLTRFALPGDEAKFARLLNDSDERLHASAMIALEKITGQQFSKDNRPLSEQRASWLEWLKTSRRGT